MLSLQYFSIKCSVLFHFYFYSRFPACYTALTHSLLKNPGVLFRVDEFSNTALVAVFIGLWRSPTLAGCETFSIAVGQRIECFSQCLINQVSFIIG